MHIASIESGVTLFANSVLGARSNGDGFFAVYAGITGHYPRFGLHCQENRSAAFAVDIESNPAGTTACTVPGYAIGRKQNSGMPMVSGLSRRLSLDELEGLRAGMATSGGAAMLVVPGTMPPCSADAEPDRRLPTLRIRESDLADMRDEFCNGTESAVEIVQVGRPHASFEEMGLYSELPSGRRVHENFELWVTTSLTVRQMAQESGLLASITRSGAKVVSDACPISCHFSRSCSPDSSFGVRPTEIRTIVVDSAQRARYVRDMVGSPTSPTTTEKALETAVTGKFVSRT